MCGVTVKPPVISEATMPDTLASGIFTDRASTTPVPCWVPRTLTLSPTSRPGQLGASCQASRNTFGPGMSTVSDVPLGNEIKSECVTVSTKLMTGGLGTTVVVVGATVVVVVAAVVVVVGATVVVVVAAVVVVVGATVVVVVWLLFPYVPCLPPAQ